MEDLILLLFGISALLGVIGLLFSFWQMIMVEKDRRQVMRDFYESLEEIKNHGRE